MSREAKTFMWRSVINYLQSLRTYRDLSPDVDVRRRVNARLKRRSKLSPETWSVVFADMDSESITPSLLSFIYRQLQEYSGLDVGRMRIGDRLIEDLQLPLVCWFDWPNQLCDDFQQTFQVDISDDFDETLLETVGDLVRFLNRRLQSMDSVPS